MSFEFFMRLTGMVVLAFGGASLGNSLGMSAGDSVLPAEGWALVVALVGALTGLIITPFVSTRPVRAIRVRLNQTPSEVLVALVIGLLIGLIIAALLALPLSLLPQPFGQVFPIIGAILLSYLSISVLIMRRNDLFELFQNRLPHFSFGDGNQEDTRLQVLLDTSVIIDGRIADISQTGFITGPMLVPRFVLNELQHVADSADFQRRTRGRRGLEMLNRLQQDSRVPVRVIDMDVDDAVEVDDKLISLARRLGSAIITNDYNLNRVAQLQGITVLNINALANAVKAVLLPGEELNVFVLQEGKEIGQGVGYLDDGTMVVVEEGRRYLDKNVDVIVTKVHQTVAGRMIFARPADS